MKVTIGIPFFNPGFFFRGSINSILNQTFLDFELILLDDGSTDGSLEVAKSFSDNRIRIISDGVNLGLPSRLNKLTDLAKGEYIARMDADDLVASDRIIKQVEYLNKNKDINLVSTGICSISNTDDLISFRLPTQDKRLNTSINTAVYGKTEVAHASIMARKDWYVRNRYNETAKLMEDYQLWLDATIKNDFKVGFIKEPLYFYREESSTDYNKIINSYKNQLNIIKFNYKDIIPIKTQVIFTVIINFKIFITMILHRLGFINKLINIRNRKTPQVSEWRDFIVKELSNIPNLKAK